MLKNYIKIALKVLKRKKFFTFISLFGISFTILVLMVTASILDKTINPGGTELKIERILTADRLMATDTTRNSSTYSGPGFSFLNKFMINLTTPELISIHSSTTSYYTYPEGRKTEFNYMYTDGNFWKIYQFKFIDGKPYGTKEYDNSEKVAVISKSTAKKYFGETDVIGKSMDIAGSFFKIAGVVENVPVTNLNTFSDIWIPSTTSKDDINHEFFGSFKASILAYSRDDFNKIRSEFHKNLIAAVADVPTPSYMHILKCELKSQEDILADKFMHQRENMRENTTEDASFIPPSGFSRYNIVSMLVVGFMFLFMLLPSINLVNINLSRMIERSSEIAVRKAFGASRNILVGQFITENLILTFLGGLISLVLTVITLSIINNSGYLPNTVLTLDFKIFLYGMLICIVFGFFSGVYPAYRMSKMHPVEALRGGNK